MLLEGSLVGAHGVAEVEVAVSQGLFHGAGVYPVPVHAEGAKHHFLVVFP